VVPVDLKGRLARVVAFSSQRPTDVDRIGSRFSLTSVRKRERFISCGQAAVSDGLWFSPRSVS